MFRNAVAVLPIVPNAEMIAKPVEPQLHTPALAPIIGPAKLPLSCFVCNVLTLKMLMLTTKPDNAETITTRVKPTMSSFGI